MDVPEINSISPGPPQEGNFRSEADKNSFRERGVRREICGTKKTAYRLEPPRKEILGAKRKKIPSAREGGGGGYAELIKQHITRKTPGRKF